MSPAVNGEVMIGNHSRSKLLKIAENTVERKTKGSEIMSAKPLEDFPHYDLDELEIGKVLGRGGFCVVSDITKIKLRANSANSSAAKPAPLKASSSASVDETSSNHVNIVQNRDFMEQFCIRDGKDCRYAIKKLQETDDSQTFTNGVVDLVIEARVLANIRHPNIIKMRALSSGPFYDGNFFLILDKLYDILSNRLNTWKKKKGGPMMSRLMDRKGKKYNDFLSERLVVAYDLSCALGHLHKHNLIYRDIKPDNIGFDVRGDVKIFDFGLAKEFDRSKANADGTYHFTADTGSPRYMAPEVALEQTYNEKVDCYSFSILVWQMLKLEVPYDTFNMRMLRRNVFEKGVRPKSDPKWSKNLSDTLANGWLHDRFNRWDMDRITEALSEELSSLDDMEGGNVAARLLVDRSEKSMHMLRNA